MLPTLFLLTGSLISPSPYQIELAKLTTPPVIVRGRQPDVNGPDAILLKYKIEAIPMGGHRMYAPDDRLFLTPEELQKRNEEQKRRRDEIEKLLRESQKKKQPPK